MSTLEPHDSLTADWQEIEDFLSSLHELARAPLSHSDFYSQLLGGSIRTLAASGGAVWQRDARRKWRVLTESFPSDIALVDAHETLLDEASSKMGAYIFTAGQGSTAQGVIATVGVQSSEVASTEILIELFMRAGCSPSVQKAWQEFLQTVANVAEEFELRRELSDLRHERSGHQDVLALLRQLQQGSTLKAVAYDIANEGARFTGSDRLSVVLKQNDAWKLIAASGAESFEARSDAVKDLQKLAAVTADWGEPLDYVDGQPTDELPQTVSDVLSQYVDNSHAKRILAVPLELAKTSPTSHRTTSAVLIGETFRHSEHFSRERMLEIAYLCEPALRQAVERNSWLARAAVSWSSRWDQIRYSLGLSRLAAILVAVACLLAALVFVRADFEIEAEATLVPRVIRDVFASTNATVQEVKVQHGDMVTKETILATLKDPELDLETERVKGELATVAKRLEAIAVARTDREILDEVTSDRLPLSAEAKQLELRRASLLAQLKILDERRDSLVLRSPIDGIVLTFDVQDLLRSRPVERGQLLFTVGDTNSGWDLETRVPQDQIGHLLNAKHESSSPVTARFRLAGDFEHVYAGKVISVTESAVLDMTEVDAPLPDVQVRIEADEQSIDGALPQMAASVRLNCGRRSLGYVWLHGIWDNIYSWLAF